ncbi:MAG: MBL fold metallo-hydrolase [Pseudonocardiaceae bacterium]
MVDGWTYVIDCGRSATTQYIRAGLSLRSLNSIFLTHLHADHIADYYNFFLLGGHQRYPSDETGHDPNSQPDSIDGPIQVYGPGPAGGLPPTFGRSQVPTVEPADPTPGTAAMTEKTHEAYAYSSNIFMRDISIPDIRTLTQVHEIAIPTVGANYTNTAPAMRPFLVMRDDRVQVTATLVPHGPVFPAFAYRFDTKYGSVTFSGDTTKTDNLITLAQDTDILVHEAINIEGANPNPAMRNHLLRSHVPVQMVGPIAQNARAKKLVLSHIGDHTESPINIDKWTKWANHGYDGPASVGQDLQRFIIA